MAALFVIFSPRTRSDAYYTAYLKAHLFPLFGLVDHFPRFLGCATPIIGESLRFIILLLLLGSRRIERLALQKAFLVLENLPV